MAPVRGRGRHGRPRRNSCQNTSFDGISPGERVLRSTVGRGHFSSRRRVYSALASMSSSSRETVKCCECKAEDAPYRCPLCFSKYCSKECYKTHKSGVCPETTRVSEEEEGTVGASASASATAMEVFDPSSVAAPYDPPLTRLRESNRRKQTTTKKYSYPTKDTVRPEGLQKLSKEPYRNVIKNMLSDDTVRGMVINIDNTNRPKAFLEKCMQNEKFSKFSNVLVDALSDELVTKLSVRRK